MLPTKGYARVRPAVCKKGDLVVFETGVIERAGFFIGKDITYCEANHTTIYRKPLRTKEVAKTASNTRSSKRSKSSKGRTASSRVH